MNEFEFLLVGGNDESRSLTKVLRPPRTKSSAELRNWLTRRGARRKILFVSGAHGYQCVRQLLQAGGRLHYPECQVMALTGSTAPLLDGFLSRSFGSWLPKPPALLPWKQLKEALHSDAPQDLCIGGEVDRAAGLATLVRGDFSLLVVPLSAFPPSGDGTRPRFDDFIVTDHGQTLRFGDYEAAFDAVLYEFDPEYRRRLKKHRIAEDQTFGASLRRLRLQKGIGRADFPGIDAKTIARIERGEVAKPHAATSAIIAKKLGVKVQEIGEY